MKLFSINPLKPKPLLCALAVSLLLPLLCGCGSIYSNYQEIDRLLIIQAMGIDLSGQTLLISLSSAADSKSERGPVRLCAEGSSVTTAIQRIDNHANEDALFYSHISHVVLGEALAKQGIGDCMSYLCRSPEIQIDVPVYVLKSGEASELILDSGNEKKGSVEILQAVEADLASHADSSLYSASDIVRDIYRNGSALICAIEYETSANSGKGALENGGETTASVYGYGVIKGDRLCAYIDAKNAVGVGLLENELGISDIELRDKFGSLTVVELISGSTTLSPVWQAQGSLAGINVDAEVTASVIEVDSRSRTSDADYYNQLTAQLEQAISERICSVLRLSMEQEADFLGLGKQIELEAPELFRAMPERFSERLPQLELQVTVSGRLMHTNDLKDA